MKFSPAFITTKMWLHMFILYWIFFVLLLYIYGKILLPIFENIQNLDATLFLDVANIWGVDYDSSIDKSNKIRSSIGLGLDWFSVVGPINFSLTESISKAETDITESFRFNIGTTF